jgi:hypothetical protein
VAGDHGRLSEAPIRARSNNGGAIGVLATLVGNIVAWEGLRILLQLPLALAGRSLEIDFMNLEFRYRLVPRLPSCKTCGT